LIRLSHKLLINSFATPAAYALYQLFMLALKDSRSVMQSSAWNQIRAKVLLSKACTLVNS